VARFSVFGEQNSVSIFLQFFNGVVFVDTNSSTSQLLLLMTFDELLHLQTLTDIRMISEFQELNVGTGSRNKMEAIQQSDEFFCIGSR
jgi:hypothetical protein